jgi:hypothetical protein
VSTCLSRQSISGEYGITENVLAYCFHALPDAKPVPTFAGIALGTAGEPYDCSVFNHRHDPGFLHLDHHRQATEPALRPIRRIIPDLGGLDISPIVLLIAIFFVRTFIATSIAPMFF